MTTVTGDGRYLTVPVWEAIQTLGKEYEVGTWGGYRGEDPDHVLTHRLCRKGQVQTWGHAPTLAEVFDAFYDHLHECHEAVPDDDGCMPGQDYDPALPPTIDAVDGRTVRLVNDYADDAIAATRHLDREPGSVLLTYRGRHGIYR